MSIYRAKGTNLSPHILNLFKNTIALSGMLILALILGLPLSGAPASWWLLGLSGIVGLALGDTFFFAALRRLGAQITAASTALSPPLTAIIAWLILSEPLSFSELTGMVLATGGVALTILWSRSDSSALRGISTQNLFWGVVFAALSSLCQGVGVVMQRVGFQEVSIITGSMMRLWPAIAFLLLLAAFQPDRASLRADWSTLKQRTNLLWIGSAAFIGAFLGCLLMAAGAKFAKAGVAALLSSSHPLWVIPIAWVFLGERVTPRVIAAILLAMVGIALIAR
jgi:drug/metabolite transporter (DMT)-like permease